MKTIQWAVFAALVVAQLAVPFSMIATREWTLHEGAEYKFRCGPVDPYDYFRGRYVALSFPNTIIEDFHGPLFTGREKAYALLGRDETGFANFVDVFLEPPSSGDYLEVTAWGGGRGSGSGNTSLWMELPFNRYYMNELDAPAAEGAYRTHTRSEDGAHVIARIRGGHGVLAGLFIGETPIEEFLENEMEDSVQVPGSQ